MDFAPKPSFQLSGFLLMAISPTAAFHLHHIQLLSDFYLSHCPPPAAIWLVVSFQSDLTRPDLTRPEPTLDPLIIPLITTGPSLAHSLPHSLPDHKSRMSDPRGSQKDRAGLVLDGVHQLPSLAPNHSQQLVRRDSLYSWRTQTTGEPTFLGGFKGVQHNIEQL